MGMGIVLLSIVFACRSLVGGWFTDNAEVSALVSALLLWALHLLCRKRNGKAPSPILMILISAGLGILFWGA